MRGPDSRHAQTKKSLNVVPRGKFGIYVGEDEARQDEKERHPVAIAQLRKIELKDRSMMHEDHRGRDKAQPRERRQPVDAPPSLSHTQSLTGHSAMWYQLTDQFLRDETMRSFLFAALACLVLGACDQQSPQQAAQQPAGSAPDASVCADDIAKLCAGVESGEGRIGACLSEHKEQVSEACRRFNNI